MTETTAAPADGQRTSRADFQATGDPGVGGPHSHAGNLLTYAELYQVWERQHWSVYELDFTQDRIDWHERIGADERFQRMFGLSSFFIGEQRVEAELGPMMRAVPSEEMRIFLCTQIADEARHVAFFDRFYAEVGVLEGTDIEERLTETRAHVNSSFDQLFDDELTPRVDRLAAEPGDLRTLVEAITIYHMIIEGVLALTGQHFIIDYHEQQGTLPGFVEGFTNVARDEHRHVAFGARFLREMASADPAHGDAIRATLQHCIPIADGVLRPNYMTPEDDDLQVLGSSVADGRAFAATALDRRLKAIGLPL